MRKKNDFMGIGSPVKDFISSFYEGVEEGLKERGLIMCQESECFTKMDLNAIATGETKAGGGAKIMSIGGSIEGLKSNTQSQKMTIFAKKVRQSDLEKEKAEIAKAQAEQKLAHRVATK